MTHFLALFILIAINSQPILAAKPEHCCPQGWNMYSCHAPNGRMGLNCHNPAMGCPSSLICGQGCDTKVSCRCQAGTDSGCGPSSTCVENVLCIQGTHWDSVMCKCVPDVKPACQVDSDCHGHLPLICAICPDHKVRCAHWMCQSHQCETTICGSSAEGQLCGPDAVPRDCSPGYKCDMTGGIDVGHCK